MNPLIRTATNEELDAETEKAKKANGVDQAKPIALNLAAHINRAWEAAKQAKMEIETRLFKCMRQRAGEYDPDAMEIIKQSGGTDIYMMLTEVKCRSIEAQVKDIVMPAGEKPWTITPSPVPDIGTDIEEFVLSYLEAEVMEIVQTEGPEVITPEFIQNRRQELIDLVKKQDKEKAEEVAEKQAELIDDALTEGQYYEALDEFVEDYATFPAAFLKGPIVRKRKTLQWVDVGGMKQPQAVERLRREYRRVSPFDIYPSPGAKSLQDGYLIERLRLRPKELQQCLGVPGFKDSAILAVLATYQDGLKDWLWTDQERARLENRPHEEDDPDAIIEALEFHGSVQGSKLIQWGMSKKEIDNPNRYYTVKAWLIGPWVVMARMNYHPLGKRYYYKASFKEVNDSIWGKAPPELMRDCQRVCNAAARALVNNMGIASGPMVEVHKDRLADGETVDELYPWRIINTKASETGTDRPAVYFYQPNLLTAELMAIFEKFNDQAGEQVGVPKYEHGSTDVGGAGETARGLSMLMSAASKIIKDAIRNIDNGPVRGAVRETWLHIVMYDQPEEAGDANIVARASEYMVMQEQLQMLRRDWLGLTNNPTDMRIIGLLGRAEVLRETAKQLKLPADDIVPERKELIQMLNQQQQMLPAPEQEGEIVEGGNAG